MAYYFTPGPPVAGIPQSVSDKPGLYGTYNGHIAAPSMPVPAQRTASVAGAPIIQPGPPMPQPGGPPPMGLPSAGPLTAPSPLAATTPGASPLQPGASPLHPGASPLQPGTSPLQPGSAAIQPGTSPLQPGASPYPVSVSSSAPTYISALPSGMYASSAGLYQGATIAYPQPAPGPPPAMAPPSMATNPYMGRPITPYTAQGTPIHTMPMVQPPCTQTLMAPAYHGLAQAPVYSSQGYAVVPGAVLGYAAPTQGPPVVPAGALSSPYPQVMSQGFAGPGPTGPPGASYNRPPSMP